MTSRRTRCPHCKGKLDPGQRIHPDCIAPWAEAQQAKADRIAAKIDRALTRDRKAAMKTIPQLIKETQRAFNEFIRERDRELPCICCGMVLQVDGPGGGYDCGHYRSVGTAPHLRFDERNAHGQRKSCNRWGAGRAVDYRIGLIGRIGLTAVESIEADNAVRKWTREELTAIRDHYRAKTRELRRNA